MKKVLYFISIFTTVLSLGACMEIDNFDAPNASITGRIIDKTTGKNMLLDQGTGHIRIWEMSYSTNPTQQDLAVKQDGTYTNTKLFAGTYDMIPFTDIACWPCDTTFNVKIGSNGAVQDFEVTPYLHLVDYKAELNGLNLTMSCRLQAPVTSGFDLRINYIYPFISLNQFCGAGSHLDYYYTDEYRVKLNSTWTKLGGTDGEGYETYSITIPVKAGYTYWTRMGAQINNTSSAWNYSEIIKVDVPQ